MSDVPGKCMLEYGNKVVICESELGYASKVLEQKPLFALAIPCSLLLQWNKALSEQASKGVEQLVDYTFLLEVSIRGNILRFTDDKAKRDEINQHLAKIAGSVATLSRKTKGRAKQQLENRVRSPRNDTFNFKIVSTIGGLSFSPSRLQKIACNTRQLLEITA